MKDPRQTARDLIEQNDITLERLWASYWGNGGSAAITDLDAYIYEAKNPPQFELTLLALAIEDLEDTAPRA